MLNLSRILLIILISTSMINPLPYFSIESSFSTQTTPDYYLVNTRDFKVLRVPHSHQDYVGHCWLYSLGMIVTFYGKQFRPEDVLMKMNIGYNFGLCLDERCLAKFARVVEELYSIQLRFNKRPRSSVDFFNIIKNEIDNKRPIYTIVRVVVEQKKRFHAIVIIGYKTDTTGNYVIINDPSGAFIYYVNEFTRFDGSEIQHEIVELLFRNITLIPPAYGVIVPYEKLYNELFYYASVNTTLEPNPPDVVVYPYTLAPQASVNFIDMYGSPSIGRTRFYHNNLYDRSLWHPFPIVSGGSNLRLRIYIYPNINYQRLYLVNLTITLYAKHRDVKTVLIPFEVVNYTRVNLFDVTLPDKRIFINKSINPYSPYYEISLVSNSAGIVDITISVVDGNIESIVYKWGSLEAYLYDDVSVFWVSRDSRGGLGNSIVAIFAGVLYNFTENGMNRVDIFIQFNKTNSNWRKILLSKPCEITVTNSQPDPKTGGYYYVCSLIVDPSTTELEVYGKIDIPLWFDRELRGKIILNQRTDVRVNDIEFLFSKQDISVKVEYINRGAFRYLELIHNETTYKIPLKPSQRESSSIIPWNWNRVPGYNFTFEVSNDELISGWFTLLNPYATDISQISSENIVYENEILALDYQLEIPAYYRDSFEILVYLNGTLVESASIIRGLSVRKINERYEFKVYSIRTYIRIPNIDRSEAVYNVTILPRFVSFSIYLTRGGILRLPIISYSWDVRAEKFIKVVKKAAEITGISSMLVIDVSGSMGDTFREKTKLDWAKNASIQLINLAYDGDFIGLIKFSTYPEILVEPVIVNATSREILIKKIESLYPGGSTNIGDSLKLAADLLNRDEFRAHRRVIILLTDGIHNTGTHPYEVLDYIKELRIKIFTIGLGYDVDEDLLSRIAEETGGKYYFAPTPDELAEIFLTIREEALVKNIISKDTFLLKQNESIQTSYVINLMEGKHILEIKWTNSEPYILLSSDYFVVDQYNASEAGFIIERPLHNYLRIVIPENMFLTNWFIGQLPTGFTFNKLTLNVTLFNKAQTDTLVELTLVGEVERILELFINKLNRVYRVNELLHYIVLVEPGAYVVVRLRDENGTIVYTDIPSSMGEGVLSTSFAGFILLNTTPGKYLLEAILLKDIVLKTVSIPITIEPGTFVSPASSTHLDITGYGEYSEKLVLEVLDPDLLGNYGKLHVVLTSNIITPLTPAVVVEEPLIELDSVNIINLNISIPPTTTPGSYNYSLVIYIPGKTIITLPNVIRIQVPRLRILSEKLPRVIILRENLEKTLSIDLGIISEYSVLRNISISPLIDNLDLRISPSYLTISTNETKTIDLTIRASKPGVYTGYIVFTVDNTVWDRRWLTIVVVPKDGDINEVYWSRDTNYIVLGPFGADLATATFAVRSDDLASAIVTKYKSSIKPFDYLIYYTCNDYNESSAILSIEIPRDLFVKTYKLVVMEGNRVVKEELLTRGSNHVLINLDPDKLYRVYIEEYRYKPSSGGYALGASDSYTEKTEVTYEKTYNEILYIIITTLVSIAIIGLIAIVAVRRLAKI